MRPTLAAALLALPLTCGAQMLECRTATGWYGATQCDAGAEPVPPHNLIAQARQCVVDMDEVMRRERAIGREAGFVNAAALHEAARRKLTCQREVADYTRQVEGSRRASQR
jgi:hypothetical protein